MLEVAEICRRHGAAYRAQQRLLPSQLRAMQDIEACRTPYFGGHLKQCDHCGRQVYAYHSCLMGSNFLWGVGCGTCLVRLAGQAF